MPEELTILERLQAYANKVDDPARLAQFQTFGPQHYADAEFLNLLREGLVDIYQNGGGGGGGGGGTIDQDNIFITKTLAIQAAYTPELLAIALNNAAQYSITEKQLMLFFVSVDGTPTSQFDIWILSGKGKGTYGFNSGNPLSAANLKKIFTLSDISLKLTGTQATDAETQTASLPMSGGKYIDTLRFFNWQESSRFRSLVRAVSLAGLSVATGGDITTADTIISAFGKLQYNLTNLRTAAQNMVASWNFTADLTRGSEHVVTSGAGSTSLIKRIILAALYPGTPDANALYLLENIEFKGPVSVSATASVTVNIPHLQAFTPSFFAAQPMNALATGSFAITADATNIILTYSTARTAGTASYMLQWQK